MQRITFSADPELIQRARAHARERNTSLNVLFRNWLREIASAPDLAAEFRDLLDRTAYVDAGRRFTREEMNQR